MLDGWLGCQLSPQLVNLQTDFKNEKNLTMHAMYLFFVDDSKILHFTSPVAIVITTSELRPEIVGTCDNAHTDNQTKQPSKE